MSIRREKLHRRRIRLAFSPILVHRVKFRMQMEHRIVYPTESQAEEELKPILDNLKAKQVIWKVFEHQMHPSDPSLDRLHRIVAVTIGYKSEVVTKHS